MLTKAEVQEKLDELNTWFKENPKLPAEIHPILLKRFLKCMYGDVEETKKLIELNYTLRNKSPHIFLNRDPEDESTKQIRTTTQLLILPGLTPEGYRILSFRLVDPDPSKMSSLEECKVFVMVSDASFTMPDMDAVNEKDKKDIHNESLDQTEKVQENDGEIEKEKLNNVDSHHEDIEDNHENHEDDEDDDPYGDSLANGVVQILDLTGYTMSHLTRISFLIVRVYMKYLQEAYPVRLRAMHVINCPSYLDKMIAIMRPFIRDDVYKMMHFHTSGLESLYQHVPREMLPNEYGGEAGSFEDLKTKITQTLKENRDYLMDSKQWKVQQAQNARRGFFW